MTDRRTKSGATKVIILKIGWQANIAVPNEATLRKLLDALSRCVIVSERHRDGTYWLPEHEQWQARIEYHQVPAANVHLDRKEPEEDPQPREAVNVPARLLGRSQMLLEDLR